MHPAAYLSVALPMPTTSAVYTDGASSGIGCSFLLMSNLLTYAFSYKSHTPFNEVAYY